MDSIIDGRSHFAARYCKRTISDSFIRIAVVHGCQARIRPTGKKVNTNEQRQISHPHPLGGNPGIVDDCQTTVTNNEVDHCSPDGAHLFGVHGLIRIT